MSDKYEEWIVSTALTDHQKEEIELIINMSYSDGKLKGETEVDILTSKIEPYLNR